MPSHRFKNVSSGRPARSSSHNFLSTFSAGPSYPYGNVYSSSDMAHVEESVNDLAHIDKRSAHNALERQRRENLNSKFQQLAHALPSLQTVRRPSKTVIVAKSLEFVSSSVTRETKFQSQIEHLRRENERLRDQASRNKQQRSTTTTTSRPQTVDGTVSSSSSASSLMEQPMYLSPDQLVLSNASSIEQLAVGDASTAATYSGSTAQISPPPSPATKSTTSPKRKASLNFEVGNNNSSNKREKLSPQVVGKNASPPETEKKMRQNSTSSLDASFMMMMTTSDAAPPPDQSAIAALAEQQQQQQQQQQQTRRPMQRVFDQGPYVRQQRASSAAGNMMPGFMLDQQPNYYERTMVSQQQMMVNLAAAPPFIDQPHGSAMMVNNGNYPMMGYSQPATTGYLPDAPAMTQYPLMDLPSVFPPPYFQHDPNHDYHAFNWS